MRKLKIQKHSLRLSLLCASVITALQTPTIYAQQALDESNVERIKVTGSLIRRASGFDQKSPVRVVDREEFSQFSPTSIDDIVKNLTVSGGTESINEFGSLSGTSQINLRGLGLGSTLTLVNGRRGGISAVSDGGGNQFFDINQLPLAMIERVDFLTDGASATYGSQAVAGVANIITRKGFEGFEIDYQRSEASNTGDIVNIATGLKGDKGSINFYATYKQDTGNNRTDFDWLRERTFHTGDLTNSRFLSGTGGPGTYRLAVQDPTTGEYSIGETTNLIADPDCEAANGIETNGRCRFIFADQVAVLQDQRRFQVFSEGSYFLNDDIEVFFEGSFSRNRISGPRLPGPYLNGLAEGGMLIPASHPFNFFIADPNNAGQITYIEPASWDNNIHTAVDIGAIARPLGIDPNRPEPGLAIDLDYWRGVIGANFTLSDYWDASISYMSASSKRNESRPYEWVSAAVNGMLLDGTFNPFGISLAEPTLVSPKDGVSLAGNSFDVTRALWRTSRDSAETSQRVFDALITGELFELQGRPVNVAFGAQLRQESLKRFEDSLRASGIGASPATQTFTPLIGGQEVVSFFTEAIVPLADNFELQLALRHEDFRDDGFTTTDPKIAARWDINEQVSLRGSYGTSFQAPSVSQTGETASFVVINDSARLDPVTGQFECITDGTLGAGINTLVRTVGSEDLLPQDADSYSLGLILAPNDNLNVSLDYWRFDYTNLITPDAGGEAIVQNDCNDGVLNDQRIVRDSGGQLAEVTSFFINAGSVLSDGLDLSINYLIPTDEVGDFTFGLNGTWVNKFEVDIGDGSPVFDAAGNRNFTNPFRSTPELRANVNLNWNNGSNQAASIFVRYIHSYDNDQAGNVIDSWTTVDLQYSYEFPDLIMQDSVASITFGANNVFDEDPPSLGEGQRPGYDSVIHSVRGRVAYVQFGLSFD